MPPVTPNPSYLPQRELSKHVYLIYPNSLHILIISSLLPLLSPKAAQSRLSKYLHSISTYLFDQVSSRLMLKRAPPNKITTIKKISQFQACLMGRSTYPSCCLALTQSASSASPGEQKINHLTSFEPHQVNKHQPHHPTHLIQSHGCSHNLPRVPHQVNKR